MIDLKTKIGNLILKVNTLGFSEVYFESTLKHPINEPTDQINWVQQLYNFVQGNDKWVKLPYNIPQATPLQHQVWRALTTIPVGETRTYGEIAHLIGYGNAIRAVANSCAANPCAIIIPCHRVVPKSGGLGGYRWGEERKSYLLSLEKSSL